MIQSRALACFIVASLLLVCAAAHSISPSQVSHSVDETNQVYRSTFTNFAVLPAVTEISLVTKDLIYDSATQRIYASVPPNDGARANTITPIDPVDGTIGNSVSIGSDPGKLAISDDHQYIYVSLDGAPAVRRFNLNTQSAGLQFSLGSYGPSEPFYVEDLEVLPGQATSIAVSRKLIGNSPRHAGVAIYDDGVMRPTVSAPFPQSGSNVIEFSTSNSTLYGYCNETTENGFRKMTVNASGVSVQSVTERIVYAASDIRYNNGLVYSTVGEVVDPQTLRRVGLFRGVVTQGSHPLVLPDSTANRVYFLTGGGVNPFVIRAFDQNTFIETASLTLTGVTSFPRSFIKWGSDGLAFNTNDKIFVLQTSDLIPMSATPLPFPVNLGGGIIELPLLTNELIYDQGTQRVYATVPSYAGSIGNSLIPIDPQTGSPDSPTWVGSEPSVMARSNDGQYLYVALDGGGSIRRFHLPSKALQLDFSIGLSQTHGSRFAYDLQVLPSNPNSVAVSRINMTVAPLHEGVAIYNNGSELAAAVSPFNGVTEIEFSSSVSSLYGYDGGSTGFYFRKMAVSDSGVTLTATLNTPISGLGTSIKYDNGRVYSSKGDVIDPELGTGLGNFQVLNPSSFFYQTPIGRFAHAFVPDSSTGRVFFLIGSDSSTTLQVCDQNSFQLLGSLNIPGVQGAAGRLIRWGANGLAFNTSSGQVFFVQTALIPSPSPTPTPTPTPTPSPTPVMQLALEDSLSTPGAAVALDSALLLRDPFRVFNPLNLFVPGSDRNTRLAVFVTNLQLSAGESPSSVVVVLGDSSGQTFNLGAEAVIPLPGSNFTEVVFRLPTTLTTGTAIIQVNAHGQTTNSGTIRIVN